MKRFCAIMATGILLCATAYAQERAAADNRTFDGPKVKIEGYARSSMELLDNSCRVWKNVSPGFMNVPLNVKIDGDTISVLIDIGGLIQSTDGGKSWRHLTFNNYDGITSCNFWDFDINPVNKQNIVIGGQLLFRSVDGGKSWKSVEKGLPEALHGSRQNGFGQVKFNCDGSLLLAGIGTDRLSPRYDELLKPYYKSKLLFLSKDGGESFSVLTINTPFSTVRRIFTHPTRPEFFLLSFADGEFYACFNATSPNPELKKLDLPNGYYLRDVCARPDMQNEFIASLGRLSGKDDGTLLAISLNGADARMESIPLKDANGTILKEERLYSVGFNPNRKNQFITGVAGTDYLLISDDNLKSFRKRYLPREFFCDEKQDLFYGCIESVYFGKSAHAVANSRVGMWISDDGFDTMRDLTMAYGSELFGNHGVGMPANVNSLSITKGHAFFCAQDHGAWMSGADDYSKWKLLSGKDSWSKFPTQPAPWGAPYTWLHEVQRMFASHDEKFLYISCNAMLKKKFKHSFWAEKKIFLSRNLGESWSDVTPLLGKGDVYPEGSQFFKVLFAEDNSDMQWFLFSDAVYLTVDGAKTFKRIESPLFAKVGGDSPIAKFTDIAYDSVHNILYLGSATAPQSDFLLGRSTAPAALYRSLDKGLTWEVFNIGQNSVRSLDVIPATGDLVIGTQLSGSQPGRLLIIPFGSKYDDSMIKLTVGDEKQERAANQLSVWPVVCDGKDILAYSNIEWILSDKFFAQGPLLSRDGGKTFMWILQDLPNTFIWSADMRDGKILLGTTSGIMYWKFK